MGTLTYRSGPEWMERFGRARNEGPPRLSEDFQVESYLSYQGDKFCLQYDPHSYLYISKAMDLFDLNEETGDGPTLAEIRCPVLVIGVTSDILFPVWQQRELARLLEAQDTPVRYVELDAPYGHDSFLILRDPVGEPVRELLEA